VDLQSAVIGAMAGYLSLWSVYWAFKLATGKEGMGFGDFKLLAALGAWLGWKVMPGLIIGAAAVGAIVGVAFIALGRHERDKPIPFGPFLAAAGWIYLQWGSSLQNSLARVTTP
jgi:leader peptidase (prepilin peptidase)/N-methyltransferase